MPPTHTRPGGLALMLNPQRLLITLTASLLLGWLNSLPSQAPMGVVLTRATIVGLGAMLVFGLFEQWPARPPAWLARWALQLLGVVLAIPVGAVLAYWITFGGNPQFGANPTRETGLAYLTFTGVLVAPWMALGALVRQREAFARRQANAFALERSEFERHALNARLRLLQAQVQPHFLFNTLANVRSLVRSGSPRAGSVLDSLIDYLRAAVPQLDKPVTTLAQEVQLVRAYLDLMHMRMPDRLQFALHIDEAALSLHCPPLTLLTLVENAVRHGIDPAEDGGRVDVSVRLSCERCQVRVSDSGVGLPPSGQGQGTGLATLRERLVLSFGGDAQLRLSAVQPRGFCAALDFPAQRSTA